MTWSRSWSCTCATACGPRPRCTRRPRAAARLFGSPTSAASRWAPSRTCWSSMAIRWRHRGAPRAAAGHRRRLGRPRSLNDGAAWPQARSAAGRLGLHPVHDALQGPQQRLPDDVLCGRAIVSQRRPGRTARGHRSGSPGCHRPPAGRIAGRPAGTPGPGSAGGPGAPPGSTRPRTRWRCAGTGPGRAAARPTPARTAARTSGPGPPGRWPQHPGGPPDPSMPQRMDWISWMSSTSSGATMAPRRGCWRTSPSLSRRISAARTGIVLTPRRSAISASRSGRPGSMPWRISSRRTS